MPSSEAIGTTTEDARPAENLGVRLRRAREAQSLSLDAISAELRISVPALTALEECRFEALGPPVFAKGYLKQYGSRLGLDVSGLITDYQRMVGDTSVEIEPSKTIRLRNERQIVVWIVAGLALAIAAAILATWWWLGQGVASSAAAGSAVSSEPRVDAEPATVVETASAQPTPQPPPARVPAVDASPSQESPSDDDVFVEAAAPTVPNASTGQDAGGANTTDSSTADSNSPDDALEAYTGPLLEIVFVEDSWTDITDAAGERLYYDLGRAGTRARIPADRDLNLFFGNAAGVELLLDGEAMPIPARARRGDLAQFDLEARTGQTP